MAKADHTLQQAQIRAMAVMVLARQRAIKEAKRQFQARGLRPHHMPAREIAPAASETLVVQAFQPCALVVSSRATRRGKGNR